MDDESKLRQQRESLKGDEEAFERKKINGIFYDQSKEAGLYYIYFSIFGIHQVLIIYTSRDSR